MDEPTTQPEDLPVSPEQELSPEAEPGAPQARPAASPPGVAWGAPGGFGAPGATWGSSQTWAGGPTWNHGFDQVPPGWLPAPMAPPRRRAFEAMAVAALTAVVAIAGTLAVGSFFGWHLSNGTTSSLGASGSNPSASGGSTQSASSSPLSATASTIAAKVDPALVDVNTVLGYQQARAAGTGVVLSSNGEVLTNNHVVAGATSISVTDIGNGRTYTATVVGTDVTSDVAVLRLQGASGLATINLGHVSELSVGTAVVAIGNAGGVGGTPSVSAGTVVALGQSITASDQTGANSERLNGLIETNASLQPGDSGGPLVDSSGRMIGMDTAASTGFQFDTQANAGYAIPIDTAVNIAKQIESGHGSSTVHIGAAAFLGVDVEPVSDLYCAPTSTGAGVVGVVANSPAAQAGITQGDVIVSIDGSPVDSPSQLSTLMAGHHPGDSVRVGWVDQNGNPASATVTLTTGPAI